LSTPLPLTAPNSHPNHNLLEHLKPNNNRQIETKLIIFRENLEHLEQNLLFLSFLDGFYPFSRLPTARNKSPKGLQDWKVDK
jgi:hypothetical protein